MNTVRNSSKSPLNANKTARISNYLRDMNTNDNRSTSQNRLTRTDKVCQSTTSLLRTSTSKSLLKACSNFETQKQNNSEVTNENDKQINNRHKFQNIKENNLNKKFLNAYKQKENKAQPNISILKQFNAQNNQELEELASNQDTVQWVQKLIRYQKRINEERTLLDLTLQAIYLTLFRTPGQDQTIQGIFKQIMQTVDENQFLKEGDKRQIKQKIQQFEPNSSLQQVLNFLSSLTLLFKIKDFPILSIEDSILGDLKVLDQITLEVNNVTVTEIEKPTNQVQINENYLQFVHTFKNKINDNSPNSIQLQRITQDPKGLEGRLTEYQSLYDNKETIMNTRRSSDGQAFLKKIEQSMESIAQYMKISDSNTSLQNTLTFQQSVRTPKTNQSISPQKDSSFESGRDKKIKLASQIFDEQIAEIKKQAQTYEFENQELHVQLDEAMQINQKLLERIKKLEQQLKKNIQQASD